MTTSLDPAFDPPVRPTDRGLASDGVSIAICALVTVMEGYNLIVYGAVVPALLDDDKMGITPAFAGYIGALVYVGMLFGAFGAGVIGDRVGRQRALVVAVSLFFLGALLAGFANSVTMLGFVRVLAGLGVGGAVTTALAIARNRAPRNRSTLIVTITMAGIPVGGTLASFIGMGVIPGYGWRAMFLIGAAATFVILLVVSAVKLEEPQRQVAASADVRGTGAPIRELFSRKRIALTLVIAAAAIPNMFTWFGLNTWLTAIMKDLDYALTSALLFSLTLTVGAIVGSIFTAWWADHWAPQQVGVVTALMTVVGLAVIIAGGQSTPVLLGAVALMGIGGHSTMNMINAAAANLFPEYMRGTALGWANASSYVGALGPLAAGLLLDKGFGPHSVFTLYGGSALLAAIAMTVFGLRSK